MAYIGTQPLAGQYRKLDDISSGFNGATTSFTTSVGGINVTAGSPQQLLVSLGGVIQQPTVDYTVNTSTITFTTAPASGLSFFAVLMGDALNTSVPADGSITSAKLAGSLSVGLAAGSASTPSLFFTGDTNTGIYSPGADQVAISTGGTQRLAVDTAATTSTLPVVHPLGAVGTPSITFTGDLNTGIWSPAADTVAASTGGSERARIDSSGRLLVGTSTATNNLRLDAKLAVVSTGSGNLGGINLTNYGGTTAGVASFIDFNRSRGSTDGSLTSVVSGDDLGYLVWRGATGSGFDVFAQIQGQVDGTPGSGDAPGRLVFSTTADGASSPTERMRITSGGFLKVSPTGNYFSATGSYHELHSFGSSPYLLYTAHAGASPTGIYINYSNATPPNNTSNEFLFCADTNGSVLRASIRSNGGLANFQANNVNLSDINTKKDITPVADTWDCVKEWEIVNYRYKDQPDDSELNIGVIAQQVAESCPEVITVFQEAKEATESQLAQEERLGIKEQQMYWMAIKALQESMGRIEQLEIEIAAVKAQLA